MTHSKASLASLPASSYVERVNSVANVVSTTENFSMSCFDISAMVALRSNADFTEILRRRYAQQIKPSSAELPYDVLI